MSNYQPGERLRRWLKGKDKPTPVEATPVTTFDYVMQARLDDLAADLDELKKLVLGLIGTVLAALIISLIK